MFLDLKSILYSAYLLYLYVLSTESKVFPLRSFSTKHVIRRYFQVGQLGTMHTQSVWKSLAI